MTPIQQIKALLTVRSSVDTGDALGDVGDALGDVGDALGDVGDAPPAQQNVYLSLVKIGPPQPTSSMEADLRERGFSQDRINRMTPAEAWEILRAAPPEFASCGATLDVSPPAQANPAAATPTPDTLAFEAEAHRLADQLGRLHQDGVILHRSAKDPEACFYASLLRSFDATYIGKIIPSAVE